ncbi:MAG: rhodanese-like domain-containing protein [Leptolyngbyaceae cyanobacterium bins.59]|nr:rhodanese-like domain-containing protein [Leptolyngbyaceae cyanobacterium bins.59]
MKNIQDSILDAQKAIPNITPEPPGLKPESSAHDLKARLEWGEPALTIIDVRARTVFNQGHILGAMPMPKEQVVELLKQSVNPVRDIYLYGETDEETAQVAAQLRAAGFVNVAELRGGFEAWKKVAGPTEGSQEAQAVPGPEAYNLFSNLANHKKTQEAQV